MAEVIKINNLQKKYGTITALQDISFSVTQGEIFGLLGPNGAGKTTIIRCLTTLAQPDGGSIFVSGIDTIANPRQVRRKLGYVAQEVAIDKMLTGKELLELQGALYHIPKKVVKKRIEQLIELLGLTEYSDRKTGTYSGGIRKRLDLASGLLHQPEVLVLDEPTVGLDIDSRMIIWEFLRQLKLAGTTVLITSHYLEEVDALVDRLAIIDKGKVIAEGTPSSLKAKLGGDRITLKIKEFTSDEEAKKVQHYLSELEFVEKIIINQAQGNSLNLVVKANSNPIGKIERKLDEINLPLFSISQSRPSLDDVYLAATGKTLMDAEMEGISTRDIKAEKKQMMKS